MVRLHGEEIAMFSVISYMSIFLCLAVFIRKAGRYTSSSFLFCFVELGPTFTATPPNPFYVLEGNNITFVWQYNLSGTFHSVSLQFVSSSPSRTIVFKHDINLDAGVPSSVYQDRVHEDINATRAEITIFALQRSESGEYEIIVTDSTFDPTSERMTVQVQCK